MELDTGVPVLLGKENAIIRLTSGSESQRLGIGVPEEKRRLLERKANGLRSSGWCGKDLSYIWGNGGKRRRRQWRGRKVGGSTEHDPPLRGRVGHAGPGKRRGIPHERAVRNDGGERMRGKTTGGQRRTQMRGRKTPPLMKLRMGHRPATESRRTKKAKRTPNARSGGW